MASGKYCNVWVLATPAERVPGEWIAHCLNLDIVSQGPSLHDALEAVREAIRMAVHDDLEQDLDPLDRPQAPEECWEDMQRVLQRGMPLENIDDRSRIKALVTQLRIVRPHHPGIDGNDERMPELPESWQIAALESMRHCSQHA